VNRSSGKNDRERLKQKEALIIRLQHDLSVALQEIHWSKLKIHSLEEQLRQERIARFGPRSETLTDLQLSLLDEEPSVTQDEVAAEAERGPLPEPETPDSRQTAKRKHKPHPGRQTLPAHLPRKEEIIPCTAEACTCPGCGQATTVIGYDESEQLDVEPAQYFVRVIKREKRACRRCVERSVVAAPLPERIIEKGLASNRVVVDTVIKKYCDHLPLYRQEAILRRDAGVEISRTTLDGWVMHVGELLIPIREAMRRSLLAEGYLQADETTVLVQVNDKSGKHHEGYLWQFGRPGGEVVFEFALGRGRDVAAGFLGRWEGKLQTDAYIGYDNVGGPKLIHYGCWSHARRRFVDAVKVHQDDADAVKMVLCMDALFTVERGAAELGLAGAEKLAYRLEHGESWLNEIHEAGLLLAPRVLPKSKIGEAVTYLLNQWEKLKRTFLDAEVELSNNIAENSMRPWALGRKNWLQVGSVKAGPKVAAIASVVESCRRLKLPVTDYLLDILPGLERRTLSEVAPLTPSRWAAHR
jgi:transposase